jgi:hypothetical protein
VKRQLAFCGLLVGVIGGAVWGYRSAGIMIPPVLMAIGVAGPVGLVGFGFGAILGVIVDWLDQH